MLPPLFQMEDFDSCIQNQHMYCKADAVLKVSPDNSKLVQHIKEFMLDERLDRSVVHRAICLPTELSDNQPIELQLTKLINKNLEIYNLTTEVDYHVCTNGKITITGFDFFILFLVVTYLLLVLIATYNTARKKISSKGNGSILSDLSLMESWRKRTNFSKNEDYENLLTIQGIRVLTMTLAIFIHVMVDYAYIYLNNPQSFEEQLTSGIIEPVQYILPFSIISFFVISSWLLTLQAYYIHERNGKFSLKTVGILIINRYFRLMPTFIVLLVWQTNWIRLIEGPLNFDLIDMNRKACKTYWLNKLLLLTNFNIFTEVCSPYTWSLSADFQIHVINILIMYLIFKFKLNEFGTFGMVFAVFCSMQCSILYYYDMSIFPINIKTLEFRRQRFDKEFIIVYMSTVAIASSSCIGMIMGAIYYKTKRLELKSNMTYSLLWTTLSIGLPTMAVLIAMNKYGRLGGAIVGSLIKPLFSLGIGIGILGMRYKLGGIIKRFFENKYVVFLSNFSYCIYLCQEFLILYRHRISPPTVNPTTMISDIMAVYPAAVLLGIFITLAIEEPFYSIQKKILPQVQNDAKRLEDKRK